MRVVFRVDSSLQIGSGHVMRCLTLAKGLRKNGADVIFICRKLTGNLASKINDSGFKVFELKLSDKKIIDNKLFHSKWLEVTQLLDSEQSKDIIKKIKPDWLIVDHYALDHEWELKLKPYVKYLMVIDDLADRRHECDLLLDQTLGRKKEDYDELVPKLCKMLLGASFCLLRSEFAKWRPYSIDRRIYPKFQNLLINMGGFDITNNTMDILDKLPECLLPSDLKITIVLGQNSPNFHRLNDKIKMLDLDVVVKIDVDNMAEIMANSDIAIGAAGSTSWERCCLGLPTVQFILAQNQQFLGKMLMQNNAALTANKPEKMKDFLSTVPTWMQSVSSSAARVTDGTGASKVIENIV